MARSRLAGLLVLAGLAGCGWEPVYGPQSVKPGAAPVQAELGAISVPVLPERAGQLLRQALQDRFEAADPGVGRRYELSVDYGIAGEGIGILPSATTTRIRLIARASWTLRSLDAAHKTLTSGSARYVDGVNTFDQQPFATDLEVEAKQRSMAGEIADQITLQLAQYFRKQAVKTASGG
jgi:LPS-assembly lipoprotein